MSAVDMLGSKIFTFGPKSGTDVLCLAAAPAVPLAASTARTDAAAATSPFHLIWNSPFRSACEGLLQFVKQVVNPHDRQRPAPAEPCRRPSPAPLRRAAEPRRPRPPDGPQQREHDECRLRPPRRGTRPRR